MLRTVYIEPEQDDRLREEAQRTGASKAELFRRYLRERVRVVEASPELEPLQPRPADAPALVLKRVHVNVATDDWLRVQAFDAHVPQSDYLRWCLAVGTLSNQLGWSERSQRCLRWRPYGTVWRSAGRERASRAFTLVAAVAGAPGCKHREY